jgi:hypothetical protein
VATVVRRLANVDDTFVSRERDGCGVGNPPVSGFSQRAQNGAFWFSLLKSVGDATTRDGVDFLSVICKSP